MWGNLSLLMLSNEFYAVLLWIHLCRHLQTFRGKLFRLNPFFFFWKIVFFSCQNSGSLRLIWVTLDLLGFKLVHLGSLGFTLVQLNSLWFTLIHFGSLSLTWVHLDSLGFTQVCLGLFGCTWDHLGSLWFTWPNWFIVVFTRE